MIGRFLGLGIGALALGVLAQQALAQSPQVKRGLYLVDIAGRNDCHTPGSFLGKRDVSRRLGGSDVGFSLSGMGVFVGPNDAGQENRIGQLDERADRHCDPHGQTA
jgi:hypothetical protein